MSINFISQLSLLDIHSRKNCINLYGKFETDGNHRVEGIEKMKVAKLFSGIADILIAYCVGHCSLLGTAPFGTAIIGAGSACGRSPWMLLLGLLGAFFEQGGFEKQGQMIYPLIWVMAAVLVRVRSCSYYIRARFCCLSLSDWRRSFSRSVRRSGCQGQSESLWRAQKVRSFFLLC